MSIWLVTLAREHPLTFVDHALRHGDSLVGLSRRQLEAFHWDERGAVLRGLHVREPLDRVSALRQRIRLADESVADRELRDLWDEAGLELSKGRLIGDLVVAAFFEGKKAKERELRRSEFAGAVLDGEAEGYRAWLEEWRHAERPLAPFHWELEFPEVFERESAGFDAFVGNPPFMAGKNISGVLGSSYLDWLRVRWPNARGQVDLVAFFFRRSYELLQSVATLGLIATKTIAQGDTRGGGLRPIRRQGGIIYKAIRRIPWVGAAAVTVSRVHVAKGFSPDILKLDGKIVPFINAFLATRGGDDDPRPLMTNSDTAFSGYYYYGPGFLFDDSTQGASPIAEMRKLIERDPRNKKLIHPIVGARDLLHSPVLNRKRFVIDFGDKSLEHAKAWPDLVDILERRARPARQHCKRERLRTHWWQFGEIRPGLRRSSGGLRRLLMIPLPASHLVLGFVPREFYIASPNVAITLEGSSAFGVLQSRPHEIWARFLGSSMRDDLRYTPSDCFETLPFPEGWETNPALETAGKAYYEFRVGLMVKNDEGLTKTYNRFHEPNECDPEIVRLRELHATMDRAVLEAYGWGEIPTDCEFLLDYEIDEEEWGSKKKPWRYRWPDEAHDEVLGRLLELNAERAKEEIRAGLTAATSRGKRSNKGAAVQDKMGDLFS